MKFTKLIPNVFYTDIKVGIKLFVECLQFEIGYDDLKSDHPSCVINKDNLAIFLHQSKEYAEKDRPELRLETKEIELVYAQVSKNHPELLHPNSNKVSFRPWGSLEFALLDESGVCVIIIQWP